MRVQYVPGPLLAAVSESGVVVYPADFDPSRAWHSVAGPDFSPGTRAVAVLPVNEGRAGEIDSSLPVRKERGGREIVFGSGFAGKDALVVERGVVRCAAVMVDQLRAQPIGTPPPAAVSAASTPKFDSAEEAGTRPTAEQPRAAAEDADVGELTVFTEPSATGGADGQPDASTPEPAPAQPERSDGAKQPRQVEEAPAGRVQPQQTEVQEHTEPPAGESAAISRGRIKSRQELRRAAVAARPAAPADTSAREPSAATGSSPARVIRPAPPSPAYQQARSGAPTAELFEDTVVLDDTVAGADDAAPPEDAFDDTVAVADTVAEAPVVSHEPAAPTPAAAPPEPDSVDGEPTVLSQLCPNSHVCRPGAVRCPACGEQVIASSLRMRTRPEFAVAALPDGRRVELGRGAVFGRRPRSRRMEGTRVPHLVVVGDLTGDISRSHLEMRLEEWTVLASDLGSTNGTMLLRAGRSPQRLRAHEPIALQFGDRLDLGDGVVITLEER